MRWRFPCKRAAAQVAAKQQPGGDLSCLQIPDHVDRAKTARPAAPAIGKAKPARIRPRRGLGRMKNSSQILQALVQTPEIAFAPRAMKSGSLSSWATPDGRLHVGGLQVVADVRNRCTCDRSRGAGRRAASRSACRRCCPCRARTSSRGPSRGRTRQASSSFGIVGQHAAALAHRDVVRRDRS